MHPSVYSLKQLTALNYSLILKTFDDLDDELALKRISCFNCANWIIGHMISGRISMVNIADSQTSAEIFRETYGRGSEIKPDSVYHKLSELKDGWIQVGKDIDRVFSDISYETLSAKCPRTFPLEDKTVLGGLIFLTGHENVHVGQLSMIRKELGLKTFMG